MSSTQKKKKAATAKTKRKGFMSVRTSLVKKVRGTLVGIYSTVMQRVKTLLARRPHRTFRRTRRRDYVRPLRLPGYWALTNSVRKTLVQNKKLFLGLAALYGVMTVLLIGLASQDIYTELGETIRETSSEVFNGNMGTLDQAGALLLGALGGTFNTAPTDIQRLYAVVLSLLIWLTTVWLLRAIMAGHRPKLRDGLYNAGAPFLSTFLVGLVVAVQLLPIVVAAIGFGAATSSGLLEGGVEAMVFWTAAALLAALSLYWISSTLIALIVVTLPGMYPMQAIKTAGDLVIGRRVRILLRLLWLGFTVILLWAILLLPIIIFDAWLKGIWPAIEWIPIVPIALLVTSSLTILWSSSYMYILYRKVVDDDAAPA